MSYLSAGFLLVVSLLILAVFAKLILIALIGDPKILRGRLKIRAKQRNLQALDLALERKDTPQICSLLYRSFMLDIIEGDKDLLERVGALHLELLNRIVLLSESFSKHLSELPILENLLYLRLELLKARSEVSRSVTGLRKRHASSVNRPPDWAMQEFSKKQSELNDRLKTNRKSIEMQIENIIIALQDNGNSDQITVH